MAGNERLEQTAVALTGQADAPRGFDAGAAETFGFRRPAPMPCSRRRFTLGALAWFAAGRAAAAPLAGWSGALAAANLRGFRRDPGTASGTVRLVGLPAPGPDAPPALNYAWATFPAPPGGWDLSRRTVLGATVTNRGAEPAEILLWAVGSSGWDAVPAAARLAPGESCVLECPLRETFPDGTPKLDPGRVAALELILRGRPRGQVALELSAVHAAGEAPAWVAPLGRVAVPEVSDEAPAPGRRVRARLAGERQPGLYAVLHLPVDWTPGRRWPLLVEYPGNLFHMPGCRSPGLPEQGVIGAGMTFGRGAICLGLPFVDRRWGRIAESGWGNPDETVAYALAMLAQVRDDWGADPANTVLTGFSRGALACGYIGLRDDRLAAWWKGFHACQHYDGDGWNGATWAGAMERARRFRGRSVFHTDNATAKFQPLMAAMGVPATFVQSGLGAHATAMFLDDRASTRQVRAWYRDLVG